MLLLEPAHPKLHTGATFRLGSANMAAEGDALTVCMDVVDKRGTLGQHYTADGAPAYSP